MAPGNAHSVPVVCLVEGEEAATQRTLASLSAHAPGGVRVLRGAAPDDLLRDAAPHDVVLVHAGCELTPGWLEGLQEALRSDSIAATAWATALDLRGHELAQAAERLREGGLGARPRLVAPQGPCVLVARRALDLAGSAWDGFPERCLRLGLQHLLASGVLVGGRPETGEGERLSAQERAVRTARRAVGGLSVTIDGRCLRGRMTGTEVHALGLIHALEEAGEARLRVLLPPEGELPPALAGVETVHSHEIHEHVGRTDLIHRPHQVTSAEDVEILRRLGERVVITHQDLIAYRNPAYHDDPEDWGAHRRLTREALGLADLVVFESEHARADALADDLVEPARTRLVGIGVDHAMRAEPRRPAAAPDGPFLLVLGSDFAHKNHAFAVAVASALRARGWQGTLVLAGPPAPHGREPAPEGPGVVRLGAVDEPAKAWLYENAAAVLYPTTYEGFGLIPFEAALHGTPCLWAPVASLADVLPVDLARLVPWDPEASAEAALALLAPGPERDAHVAAVAGEAARHTWARAAAALLEVYEEAAAMPARIAAVAAESAAAAEAERGAWAGRFWHLRNEIGPTGLALVGPEDPLLPEDARNALAGLLRRRGTRGPLLAMLRAARRPGG